MPELSIKLSKKAQGGESSLFDMDVVKMRPNTRPMSTLRLAVL
jgi:hypothetical protein